jgi:hypothetical protein
MANFMKHQLFFGDFRNGTIAIFQAAGIVLLMFNPRGVEATTIDALKERTQTLVNGGFETGDLTG